MLETPGEHEPLTFLVILQGIWVMTFHLTLIPSLFQLNANAHSILEYQRTPAGGGGDCCVWLKKDLSISQVKPPPGQHMTKQSVLSFDGGTEFPRPEIRCLPVILFSNFVSLTNTLPVTSTLTNTFGVTTTRIRISWP